MNYLYIKRMYSILLYRQTYFMQQSLSGVCLKYVHIFLYCSLCPLVAIWQWTSLLGMFVILSLQLEQFACCTSYLITYQRSQNLEDSVSLSTHRSLVENYSTLAIRSTHFPFKTLTQPSTFYPRSMYETCSYST